MERPDEGSLREEVWHGVEERRPAVKVEEQHLVHLVKVLWVCERERDLEGDNVLEEHGGFVVIWGKPAV